MKKTTMAKFRIEQKKWDLLTKKCKELRLTNSQFLRHCVNILLKMSPEKELDFKKNTVDRFRFYNMLNKEGCIWNFYELKNFGIILPSEIMPAVMAVIWFRAISDHYCILDK